MKYKKCAVCHQRWNVSTMDKQSSYMCPECENKLPKALLKNKRKKGE